MSKAKPIVIKPCHGQGAHWEPIELVRASSLEDRPLKTAFARVPACNRCLKPVGEWRYLTDTSKWVRDRFSDTSWALMMDFHPLPPYCFVVTDPPTMLVPEHYRPPAERPTPPVRLDQAAA